jgi:methyl-accepting chemotaxis protein
VSSFEEVALATQELARGSGDISAATEKQMSSIAEVVDVSASVEKMVEELRALVARFELESSEQA